MGKFVFWLIMAMIAYFSLKAGFKPIKKPDPRPEVKPPRANMGFTEEGDMFADPVCGTFVDPASALFILHGQEKIYFCSEDCRMKFLAELKQ
jgi:YHS domain-containing protein